MVLLALSAIVSPLPSWSTNGVVASMSNLLCDLVFMCNRAQANRQLLRMLITGLAGIIIVEIYSAVMQLKFQHSNNAVGKAFAVAGIYVYAVIYCKSLYSLTFLIMIEI